MRNIRLIYRFSLMPIILSVLINIAGDSSPSSQPTSIALLIDSRFTDEEFRLIQDATVTWNRAGQKHFGYDLFFINGRFLAAEAPSPMAFTPAGIAKIFRDDRELPNDVPNYALGIAYGANQAIIFPVRCENNRELIAWVVRHELGHLLGLPHADDITSIMNAKDTSFRPTDLTSSDEMLLCRKFNCPKGNP